jgi:hypothetical protein
MISSTAKMTNLFAINEGIVALTPRPGHSTISVLSFGVQSQELAVKRVIVRS